MRQIERRKCIKENERGRRDRETGDDEKGRKTTKKDKEETKRQQDGASNELCLSSVSTIRHDRHVFKQCDDHPR